MVTYATGGFGWRENFLIARYRWSVSHRCINICHDFKTTISCIIRNLCVGRFLPLCKRAICCLYRSWPFILYIAVIQVTVCLLTSNTKILHCVQERARDSIFVVQTSTYKPTNNLKTWNFLQNPWLYAITAISVFCVHYVLSCFHCVHPQLYTIRPQLRSLHSQLPSLRYQLPSLRFQLPSLCSQLPSLSFQLCQHCVLSSLYCVLKHKNNKMAVVDKRLSVAFPHDFRLLFKYFLGAQRIKEEDLFFLMRYRGKFLPLLQRLWVILYGVKYQCEVIQHGWWTFYSDQKPRW